MSEYKKSLEHLIKFNSPIAGLLKKLESLEHSETAYTAGFFRVDICAILTRYLNQELSSQDIHEWAKALELRDDIDFAADVDGLFRAIYLLATPELEGPLDVERAWALLDVLQAEPPCREEDIDDAYAR